MDYVCPTTKRFLTLTEGPGTLYTLTVYNRKKTLFHRSPDVIWTHVVTTGGMKTATLLFEVIKRELSYGTTSAYRFQSVVAVASLPLTAVPKPFPPVGRTVGAGGIKPATKKVTSEDKRSDIEPTMYDTSLPPGPIGGFGSSEPVAETFKGGGGDFGGAGASGSWGSSSDSSSSSSSDSSSSSSGGE